jgi:RHS repeat-associated protein
VSDPAGNPLSEMLLTSDPVNPWVKVRDYVWLDGKPLAQIEYPTPSTSYHYYLHTDHLGLPRAMTNASGQLVWNTIPRPYGDIAEKTTTDPLSGRVVVTNLRLPGQYDERLLGSLGLQGPYYNWNRWYLPGVGRYLELDPTALGGGLNGRGAPDWYNYSLGNPLGFIDPGADTPAAAIPLVLWGAGIVVGAWEAYVVQCTNAGTCPWNRPSCSTPPIDYTPRPTIPTVGQPDPLDPTPYRPDENCPEKFSICKGICAGSGGGAACYAKCWVGFLMCLGSGLP